jgi:hypothetical protein
MSVLIGDIEKKTIDLDNNYDSLTGFRNLENKN